LLLVQRKLSVSIQQPEDVEANQAEAEAKAKEKHKNLLLKRYALPKSRLFFLALALVLALIAIPAPTLKPEDFSSFLRTFTFVKMTFIRSFSFIHLRAGCFLIFSELANCAWFRTITKTHRYVITDIWVNPMMSVHNRDCLCWADRYTTATFGTQGGDVVRHRDLSI
jgi:hypothetical protein